MPGKRSTAAKKTTQSPSYDVNQLFTGFMVVTISFLVFAMWPDMSETKGLESHLHALGVKHAKVEAVCSGSGDSRLCTLQAKAAIEKNSDVITIPSEAVIQPETVAKEEALQAVIGFESEELGQAFQNAGIQKEMYYSPFAMTFKLWHEMKLGSSSSLYQWINLLPKKPNHGLFFTETEVGCLTKITAEEVNQTRTHIANLAKVAKTVCEQHKEVKSCSLMNDAVDDEFQWAYATLSQRVWGDMRQPMLVPLVDMALQHPHLCNPAGDGDAKCRGRKKQFFLSPQQKKDEGIVMKAATTLLKGEPVYATATQRSPWESLMLYGYADYAANTVTDLEFMTRFHNYQLKNKFAASQLEKDHPLRDCDNRAAVAWEATGQPEKHLRACWMHMFYFTAHPEYLAFNDAARNAFYEWRTNNKVEQAKYNFLAWRHMATSAQNVAAALISPKEDVCSGFAGNLPAIREAATITESILAKAAEFCKKKAETTFQKWVSLDKDAKMDFPEPTPPVKQETVAEGEGAQGADAKTEGEGAEEPAAAEAADEAKEN